MKHTSSLPPAPPPGTSHGNHPILPLYPGPVPGSELWRQVEQENLVNQWNTRVVYNVVRPTLTAVLPDPTVANGAGLVICPGGGFYALSIDSEGLDVARWLAAKGVACFVLKYRLVECLTNDPTTELMAVGPGLDQKVRPIVKLAMDDALAAMKRVRSCASEYQLNPKRIGIIGFSAGGTVAASVAYNYDSDSRPDFVAPIYLQYDWVPRGPVPAGAPPLFILAATDDALGLAPHSVALYNHWTTAGKSAELHLLAQGGHGFGMRKQNLPSDRWIDLFYEWLKGQRLLR